jgi:PPP family 3-phenylpropionic acid transporter
MTPVWHLRLKLSLLYAATFASLGVHLPFFPVWLGSRALSADQIGLLLSLPALIRGLSGPWITGLADRHYRATTVLAIAMVASALGWLALPFTTGFASIVPVVAFCAVLMSAIVPLTDVITVDALRGQTAIGYGAIRLWGSVAFLAANVGGGVVLGFFAPAAVPYLLAFASALAAIVTWLGRDVGTASEERRKAAIAAEPQPLSRALIFTIIGIGAIHASHALVYGFGPLLWVGQGWSTADIGLLVAVGVAAEIALFAAVKSGTAGFSPRRFLLLGAIVSMLRWMAMAFEPGLAASYGLQLLHAFSFGATHLGSIAAVSALAPLAQRARVQGYVASCAAMLTALATAGSGVLVARFGSAAYLGMIPIALMGLIAIVLAFRQPQSLGEAGNTSPSL